MTLFFLSSNIETMFTMNEFGAILLKDESFNKTSLSPNVDVKFRIEEYLKVHGCVDENEIAKALDFNIIDVLVALFEMQDKGLVKSILDEQSFQK